jgi:hypothetical protein
MNAGSSLNLPPVGAGGPAGAPNRFGPVGPGINRPANTPPAPAPGAPRPAPAATPAPVGTTQGS